MMVMHSDSRAVSLQVTVACECHAMHATSLVACHAMHASACQSRHSTAKAEGPGKTLWRRSIICSSDVRRANLPAPEEVYPECRRQNH